MGQLGWVAGLLEGEGSFTDRDCGDLVISIPMTDGDVICRLQSILGFGGVGQRLLPSGKTEFRWSSTNQATTAGLMMTLLPLMGERRRAKIVECLERWKTKRRFSWKTERPRRMRLAVIEDRVTTFPEIEWRHAPTFDLGWIAGLLEGEGYFGHRRDGEPIIEIAMTDKDVIDRFGTMLDLGRLPQQRLLPSGKTAYHWKLMKQAQVSGLMMTLLPLMGARRRAKIMECLDAWKGKSRWKLGPRCSHGHELSGDNLIIAHEGKYEKRRCKECIKLRMRKHRAKKEKPARAPRTVSTHCKHGHELIGGNLRIGRDGKYEYRTCGECARLRQAKYRDKKRIGPYQTPRRGMSFLCIDCGVRCENYHVHDSLWFSAGMPDREILPYNTSYGDFLCFECLEARIGRALMPSDFTDAPINTALLEARYAELEAELKRRQSELQCEEAEPA
jgi:hypothetical protein